ncbi:MAG: Uma2 family endonuclease [Candidatus Brocadiales bacterium]
MRKSTIKFTYEDYLHPPADGRYELIEGELFTVPAPETYHQKVLGDLEFILWSYVREKGPGGIYVAPTDVALSEEDVVQPHILFICKGR